MSKPKIESHPRTVRTSDGFSWRVKFADGEVLFIKQASIQTLDKLLLAAQRRVVALKYLRGIQVEQRVQTSEPERLDAHYDARAAQDL
jgi:hypothetical protein